MKNLIVRKLPTQIFHSSNDAKRQIIINRGGAGSGKSHAVCQLLLSRFLTERNKKILICRKYLPSLRLSIIPLFNELLSDYGVKHLIKCEKVLLNYSFKGSLIHFGSVDDIEKYKSTEWNYIWLEEATEFTYADFQGLKLRLRAKSENSKKNQMFLTFNPVDEYHWIKEKVIDSGSEDVTEIHSTYKDNPFIPDDYKQTLENLVNQDQNYYRIYACGEWGCLDSVVYSNWETIDSLPRLEGGLDVFYGLDFGYNNPSALVKITNVDDVLYLEELIYKTNLTNQDLIADLSNQISNKKTPIYADSAEPDRIEEIYKAGFNIHPSEKSVIDGIDYTKRQKLKITKSSPNLVKELRAYSYKQDKNGNSLEDPVKFLDHLMDAMRYAIYTHLGKKQPFEPDKIKSVRPRTTSRSSLSRF